MATHRLEQLVVSLNSTPPEFFVGSHKQRRPEDGWTFTVEEMGSTRPLNEMEKILMKKYETYWPLQLSMAIWSSNQRQVEI
ncbi:hypothetical protein MTR_2g048475 [Medicago truncatula]|uniref:Uncharacterized protein n=1 Tax=Medicago truncatula TaxID=3880 RepID=A0A072VI63_MEDTR|nr:hypothetical protein MTR_2g048475 [Medicago truncatula]